MIKYVKDRKKPDVIYLAVPSLSVAHRIVNYCQRENIRLIIDIQDLWPEAFEMVFDVPIINKLIFFPFKIQADKIYSAANSIIAVSKTYLNRALKVNKKAIDNAVVYLGTDKSLFNGLKINKNTDRIKIVYIGSLSNSYDLESVILAIKNIPDHKNIDFMVMGSGYKKDKLIHMANNCEINYRYLGQLPYREMIQELVDCDIAVNPIKKNSAASIINKACDYAMAGLPVVNTQESIEYRQLLKEYSAGINCENGNIEEISRALRELINNDDLRKRMGENSKKMAENLFAREENYSKIIRIILDD